jgi:hypothetical protein
VAGVRILSVNAVRFLLRRTRAFVRSTPAPARQITGRYFRSRGSRRRPKGWTDPYWLLLPHWLADKFNGPPRRVVDDLLWGQYCLFAYVRMRDDVMDRQATGASLVFAADGFLVEAERVFAQHVREEAFWAFFRRALERTAHGILEVNARQRRAGGSLPPMLAAYARVSEIFKVGSAAICLPERRRKELVRVERFADELAIAGQLLDDLEDVREDLADGRWNGAARILLAHIPPAQRSADHHLARALVSGRPLETLLAVVERHTQTAGRAVAPLRLPGADQYVERIAREMADLRAQLHPARVRAVFGPALRGPARPGAAGR